MALTHVCVWDDELGYRKTTIEEAIRDYPYGVPANRGVFICELCAQNVGLTAEGRNARHFRHTSATQNKECEERARAYDVEELNPNMHNMPVRIQIGKDYFTLEVGFFTNQLMKDKTNWCDRIMISGDHDERFVYSIERIGLSGVSYLNVGSNPSSQYFFQYENPCAKVKFYWPDHCKGVDLNGSFFDGASCLMLHAGSKAYLLQSYYLLQATEIDDVPDDISCSRILEVRTSSGQLWHLYKIKANRLSKEAARFFMRRSVFLKEKTTECYPIWPPFIETPYFIHHDSDSIWFYSEGEETALSCFPKASEIKSECIKEGGRVYEIPGLLREQLVWMGQYGALGFHYIIRETLDLPLQEPEVRIYDLNGNSLEPGAHEILPNQNLLMIQAPFDGRICILKENKIQKVQAIHANQQEVVKQLRFGLEIRVYQNLDLMCSVKFQHLEKKIIKNEKCDARLIKELIAARGEEVPLPHRWGSALACLQDMPYTKKWLYSHIRQGSCRVDALQILRKFLSNRKKGKNGV